MAANPLELAFVFVCGGGEVFEVEEEGGRGGGDVFFKEEFCDEASSA